MLLAPPESSFRGLFRSVSGSYSTYKRLKEEMQHLRGRLYLNDGAISKGDLEKDGRHVLPTDDRSWHLLTMDQNGRVAGCTRFLRHAANIQFEQLRVAESALAASDVWGARLRAAVEEEIGNARACGFSYVEVGGWAIEPSIRSTAECLRSVLATFAWSRLIGGAFGISTATERNGSASILRRLGGRPFEWNDTTLPPYFEPVYNCRMEVIRFDSRAPNERYEGAIGELASMLSQIPVICPDRSSWRVLRRNFSAIPDMPLVPAEATA